MDNLVLEVENNLVTVSAIDGHPEVFREAAAALVKAGPVHTVTGPRGVALRVTKDVAEKAGVVKKTTTRQRTTARRTSAKTASKRNNKKDEN